MTTATATNGARATGEGAWPRRLSPTVQASGGIGRMLARQAWAELTKVLRAPDFVAPVVLLPVVLYALFGSPAMGQVLPNGVALGPIITASFTAYGVLGIAMFTFGEGLASERGQGWLRLVRATPLPGAVFLLGKLAAAIVLVVLLLGLMAIASTALGAGLGATDWLRLGAVALAGGIVLAPFGSVVGLLARPSAAGAIALLLYLPLSYASGMWQPVEVLPEPLQVLAPYLPTYHFVELGRAAVGLSDGDEAVHVAWLVGTFVVAGAISAWAYRRVAGRQFA